MSTTEQLVASTGERWQAIVTHPFVVATAAGVTTPDEFDRWVVADHHFVVAFRRFVGLLVAIAPDEPARDLLASSFVPLQAEIQLFRQHATSRRLDLSAEPGPSTLAYGNYLLTLPSDGWDVAVTALFGAEKAYFDAWTAVRAAADPSPYRSFIDNWSSPAFGSWVDDLGTLVDRTVPAVTPAVASAFNTVLRYELRFWDAVADGDRW